MNHRVTPGSGVNKPDSVQQCLLAAFPKQEFAEDGWASFGAPAREQGWKIHVSAAVGSAPSVMERILPILAAERVAFKVAATLTFLANLNDGRYGLSQVGKFVTVYPRDDAQAVRLVVALHGATAGLSGPRIPSDRPLSPGSLVHYRYGGFTSLQITDELGRITPAIRTPAGNLVPDVRSTVYRRPDWAYDPFEGAGVVVNPPPPTSPLLGGRYVVMGLLHQVAKGGVYLAIDTGSDIPRTCVIKEARIGFSTDTPGWDIRDRLRYQKELMDRLSDLPLLPRSFGLFGIDGNLYLAMEELEGHTLLSQIALDDAPGEMPDTRRVIRMGRQVAEMVAALHGHGILMRDLKPGNIMVLPSGEMRLIDLELAYDPNRGLPVYGWGTVGYCSPQQARREAPAVSDDIYALGGVLFFLATGQQPAYLTVGSQAANRAIEIINPSLPARLRRLIAACLAEEPGERPVSVEAVLDDLTEATVSVGMGDAGAGKMHQSRRDHYLGLARGVGDHLCDTAEAAGTGLRWRSTAPTYHGAGVRVRPHYPTYIHTGTGGTALFLAELYARTGEERYRKTAEGAARWVLSKPQDRVRPLPGLYFGESGIAAFLLRLAQATGDPEMIAAANGQAVLAAEIPSLWPDLTHGVAGRGLVHLTLACATGDARQWELARAAGEFLIHTASPDGHGCTWFLPNAPTDMTDGAPLTGFAHGTAGIGYFLLALGQSTGDQRYLDCAHGAARWLLDAAVPSLPDRLGLNWPTNKGGNAFRLHWCHGCTGIGQFFVNAWLVTEVPEYREAAERAARTTYMLGRRGNPTQCHGLSGNGEFLIDMYQALGDRRYLEQACDLADLLDSYSVIKDGVRLWSSEEATVLTPDYMVGYAGAAAFFLRLCQPDSYPRLLTPVLSDRTG